MPISTTYGPGSITTQTDYAGGGGGGLGGGGGGGLDIDMINMFKNRMRESAADRERQRAMERQRYQWEVQDRQRAMAPKPGGNGPDPDWDLRAKEKQARMAQLDAQLYAPQQELIVGGPGIIGGWGNPNINKMNAFQRQVYAPQGSAFTNAPGDSGASLGSSERVGLDIVSPQEAQMRRALQFQSKLQESDQDFARSKNNPGWSRNPTFR